MPWGPFVQNLDPVERRTRARCRLALKLLTGHRGKAAGIALLRFEISGDDEDLLAEARTEFDRLGTVDQRRVLSGYQAVA